VCGTIDIEKALTEGIKAFEPGLLAKANRGLLYVDEVNLLDDHLVDILLDSAASGWNTVERENLYQTSARFVLVGSGNPEEGERPQLLDRFGMHAEIRTVKDPILRVKLWKKERLSTKTRCFGLKIMNLNNRSYVIKSLLLKLLPSVDIDYALRVKILKYVAV
jgi:magnesium chelatase subunit I